MPGLSQLKKLSEDVLKLGNEPKLRAERGEKPVLAQIPSSVQDIDDSEIDIRNAMAKLEEDLDRIDAYISGCNEKMWKKVMNACTKEAEEEAETKPKTTAFKCQMIKDFSQIAIYVCNINRKLYASFLNTLYHALK